MTRDGKTALYRYWDANDRLLYVGISYCWAARAMQHKERSPWWDAVARIKVEWFSSRAAANEAETRAIQSERPLHNIRKTFEDVRNWPAECARKSPLRIFPGTWSARDCELMWNRRSDEVTVQPLPTREGVKRMGLMAFGPDKWKLGYAMNDFGVMCDIRSGRMPHDELVRYVAATFIAMVVADRCDLMAVHRAFCQVSEYQELLCISDRIPGTVEWQYTERGRAA